MASEDRDSRGRQSAPLWISYGTVGVGVALAALAAAVGVAVENKPDEWSANAAATVGVVGMVVAGYAISRRPKDSITLLLAGLTAGLASFATNPAWDSIRLMQQVMGVTAAIVAGIVLLPPTAQRVAFSLMILYHFVGIMTAITSPPPQPWLTGQLWTRIFRPHLEFSYVNNAYQFYSPQPGPAQILWFCIVGEDQRDKGETGALWQDTQLKTRWYKTPIKGEMLDPLGIEYFRRLSLTERANQISGVAPSTEAYLARKSLAQDFQFQPDMLELAQYRSPTEHGRHILQGYAEHVAKVLGTGRKYPDGTPVPVHDIKVYLTEHEMLLQQDFQKAKDPYAPETYRPIFMGQFDGKGQPLMSVDDRKMLYWLVPIYKRPNESLKNFVIHHAGSDPFDPRLEWRQEP
jgi:hypothetical protein